MTKATIAWNTKQIAKAVTNKSMTFDNAIQRGHVWDRKRQSLYIDSLIRNYPVPPIFTIKTDHDAPPPSKVGSKVYDCIDGKQRCEAMRAFVNNEFALEGLETHKDVNGNEVDINGKTYEELSEDMRDSVDGYTHTVYYLSEITDDEIADMMSRLNNGKPLTGIENARIKAKDIGKIIQLANHAVFWGNMTEKSIAAYNNEDVVIKTALQVFGNQFELSTKNVRTAYEEFVFTDDVVDTLTATFDAANEVLDIIKESSKKSIAKKIVKKTNLVNVLYFVYQNKDKSSYDMMAEYLDAFFGNDGSLRVYVENYDVACTNGTNHASNVQARNDAVAKGFAYYENAHKDAND